MGGEIIVVNVIIVGGTVAIGLIRGSKGPAPKGPVGGGSDEVETGGREVERGLGMEGHIVHSLAVASEGEGMPAGGHAHRVDLPQLAGPAPPSREHPLTVGREPHGRHWTLITDLTGDVDELGEGLLHVVLAGGRGRRFTAAFGIREAGHGTGDGVLGEEQAGGLELGHGLSEVALLLALLVTLHLAAARRPCWEPVCHAQLGQVLSETFSSVLWLQIDVRKKKRKKKKIKIKIENGIE